GAALALLAPNGSATADGPAQKYLILYKQHAVPGDAALQVERAGGDLVAAYGEIGVVVASSSRVDFASIVGRDARVEGAAPTSSYATRIAAVDSGEQQEGDLPNAPASDADTFSALQWDMRQIHAPEAHAITGGSPSVVVGNIDTGLDKDHPDLLPNIDFARSASCESGAPDQNPAAWDDRHGHGTHTAGTIAAAANGIGIVGVAPNVRLAGIKSSTDDGYFFPEMVVCSFMWAGRQHLDVTNNSYFADPFLYNCRNDAVQRTIWKAEQRAIRFAMREGVTVVASEGNQSDDLSHPTYDDSSPNYPPGSEVEREITNACVVIPVEIPGVIGVTAVGNHRQTDGDDDPDDYQKSFYSSYGVSTADLTAPGGDSRQPTAEAPNGRVLSTYPAEIPCSRRVEESAQPAAAYCYLQGTSMAAPHVAGVAALIVSRYGGASSPQNGKLRPNQVEAYLQQTADPQPCPVLLPATYSTRPDGSPQQCQGGSGHTSWYGTGQVNAFSAISR
ncbi:MAG TPA: S8 family serine peptidase, partial [Mycobacteriales bacterium]|nr:S8 family serine peptidase [Mycobacteriales bacterium]